MGETVKDGHWTHRRLECQGIETDEERMISVHICLLNAKHTSRYVYTRVYSRMDGTYAAPYQVKLSV